MRPSRTLRSRLFWWLVGAIVLAIAASAVLVSVTRPEGPTGVEQAARRMASRLAAVWNDPAATHAYVDEVRDVTGFDVELVRDPARLPPHARRLVDRGAPLTPLGPHRLLVPVVRDGAVVGALEMNRFGARPSPWRWWRVALALVTAIAILSLVASRIADLLARPLEQLAGAADRFGAGDLAHRAAIAGDTGWDVVEVRDVAVSFNRMADRVEAMVRGQRELLGAISHELRSPLGRARIALEIARDRLAARPGSGTPETPARPERSPEGALDDVEAQLSAVDGILKELLETTRTGLADVRKEKRALVAWLRERLAEEPTPPPFVLEAPPDTETLALPFDAALLGRALHNLLLNCRAHGHPPDQAVVVRVSRAGGSVRVAVRDRGPGFPKDMAERAFEPFVRGDAARSRPSAGAGYGLGLSIVRRVVEAHGGTVFAHTYDDERGGPAGAEVGFELPIA